MITSNRPSTRSRTALVTLGMLALIPLSNLKANPDTVITTPVGPRPPGVYSGSKEGYLVVYSLSDRVNNGDMYYFPHSSYEIYQGKTRVKSVTNHLSINDESPEKAALPPGEYTVVAQSEKDGEVSVPVVIKTARTTVLHLEKGYASEREDFNAGRAVKTPTGQVIGWQG